MSKLVDHARREMELIGEEPRTIEGLCRVVQAYDELADSGGAQSVILPLLMDLLESRNLSPLTNDPEEWDYIRPSLWDGVSSVWQNKRNSEAFSVSEGKTYWLISESHRVGHRVYHTSAAMKPRMVEPLDAAN